MNNERFKLTAQANMKWMVSDMETGFSITFTEGLFNETQEVTNPDTMPEGVELAAWAAKAMSSIGDWMMENHSDIAICNIEARRSAIWTLSNEKYWITMAAACNSLLIDFDDNQAEYLYTEVEDFLNISGENPAHLTEAESTNLLGSLSMLDDAEAEEVFTILLAFWHEHYEAQTDTWTWACNVLWWPAWANNIVTEEEEDGED